MPDLPVSPFPKCKTCRFWMSFASLSASYKQDEGRCTRVAREVDVGLDEVPPTHDTAWIPEDNKLFRVECGESACGPELITNEAFGCVAHEVGEYDWEQ